MDNNKNKKEELDEEDEELDEEDEDLDEDDEDLDEDDEDDDDEDGDDDENDDEDDDDETEAPPSASSGTSSERRSLRGGRITLITFVGLVLVAYGLNGYLNVQASREVSDHCFAEDQRLAEAIRASEEDRMPALDWMVSLYRARRRYVQEICDSTQMELAWWRWNLTTTVEADISEHTQRDINKALTRAASSCAGEVRDLEGALEEEMERRGATPVIRDRAAKMVASQLEACNDLRHAMEDARPGFWPPLKVTGQRGVPTKIRMLMPRALSGLAQVDTAGAGVEGRE